MFKNGNHPILQLGFSEPFFICLLTLAETFFFFLKVLFLFFLDIDECSIMNGPAVVVRPSVPTLKAAMNAAVSQDLH